MYLSRDSLTQTKCVNSYTIKRWGSALQALLRVVDLPRSSAFLPLLTAQRMLLSLMTSQVLSSVDFRMRMQKCSGGATGGMHRLDMGPAAFVSTPLPSTCMCAQSSACVCPLWNAHTWSLSCIHVHHTVPRLRGPCSDARANGD